MNNPDPTERLTAMWLVPGFGVVGGPDQSPEPTIDPRRRAGSSTARLWLAVVCSAVCSPDTPRVCGPHDLTSGRPSPNTGERKCPRLKLRDGKSMQQRIEDRLKSSGGNTVLNIGI
jgi:hypothetical protein